MKTSFTILLVTLACVFSAPAITPSPLANRSLDDAIGSVPMPEVPARTAKLVAATPAADQQATAVAIITAVHHKYPSTLVAVVGAIARVAPATAPAIAGTAAALQPNQIRSIARAAAAGAQDYAGAIVAELCLQMPDKFTDITLAVARVAPNATHSILFELGEALPSLKPYLDEAKSLVSAGSSVTPTVALVMYQTMDLLSAQAGAGSFDETTGIGGGDKEKTRKKKTVKGAKKKSTKKKSKKSTKKKSKKSKKSTKKKSTKKKTKTKDYSKP